MKGCKIEREAREKKREDKEEGRRREKSNVIMAARILTLKKKNQWLKPI